MSTLEQRLIALAQAIGLDIKTLRNSNSNVIVKASSVDVPYSCMGSYSTTIADAAISPTSKIIASFGTIPANHEQDAEELAELELIVNPIAGGLQVTISGLGAFGGAFPINYMIG
ncbi:MAG: hypothetical protein K2P84_00015 [Undibacterium sp.]|nr:hypothetical protein [Undibacterium sp.]